MSILKWSKVLHIYVIVDVDICKYGVCPRDGQCENTGKPPGYLCLPCPSGYHGDGQKCTG